MAIFNERPFTLNSDTFSEALNAFSTEINSRMGGFGVRPTQGGGFQTRPSAGGRPFRTGATSGGGFGVRQFQGGGFRPSPFAGKGFGVNAIGGTPFQVRPTSRGGTDENGDPLEDLPWNPATGEYNPGTGATGALPNTDKWRNIIDAAVAGTEIDGDIVQAIMEFESSGSPGAVSVQGARGLMQVMPGEFQPGEDWTDPTTNVKVGVRVIQQKMKLVRDTYKKLGINRTGTEFWGDVGAAYLGGFDYDTGVRKTTGGDKNGTVGAVYAAKILENYARIKAARAAQTPQGGGKAGQGTPPSQRMSGIWGNIPGATISQEHGTTRYATSNPGVYSDYAPCMGMTTGQHPGLDISLPLGTPLKMPSGMSGKVVNCGGTGVYRDTMGNGAGELRVRLSNGHEIIFGHVSTISVPCGATVQGGQQIATSGGSEGAHLHLEYRVPDSSTGCGQRIVDPRSYI